MLFHKFRVWLADRFLPTWAREELLGEIARLTDEAQRMREQLRERDAYINGLEAGIRAQRRIVINTGKEAVR